MSADIVLGRRCIAPVTRRRLEGIGLLCIKLHKTIAPKSMFRGQLRVMSGNEVYLPAGRVTLAAGTMINKTISTIRSSLDRDARLVIQESSSERGHVKGDTI